MLSHLGLVNVSDDVIDSGYNIYIGLRLTSYNELMLIM